VLSALVSVVLLAKEVLVALVPVALVSVVLSANEALVVVNGAADADRGQQLTPLPMLTRTQY
jgi:hypothetical protein